MNALNHASTLYTSDTYVHAGRLSTLDQEQSGWLVQLHCFYDVQDFCLETSAATLVCCFALCAGGTEQHAGLMHTQHNQVQLLTINIVFLPKVDEHTKKKTQM